jgi:hypothetical protein
MPKVEPSVTSDPSRRWLIRVLRICTAFLGRGDIILAEQSKNALQQMRKRIAALPQEKNSELGKLQQSLRVRQLERSSNLIGWNRPDHQGRAVETGHATVLRD